MSLPATLYSSPAGLIHMAGRLPATFYNPTPRAVTECGKEVNTDTWTRISMYDQQMFGKGRHTIAKMVEGNKCDKCFDLVDGRPRI